MTDDKIKQYYLGKLDELESFELEIEVSQSEELSEQSRIVESELIEFYLSEQLSESDRMLFEQNYLITQARFEKVKFAKQFLNEVKTHAVIVYQKTSWLELFNLQKFPRLAFVIISAFLLFGGLVFILSNYQNKIEVVQQQNKNQTRSMTLGKSNETSQNQEIENNKETSRNQSNINKLNIETSLDKDVSANKSAEKITYSKIDNPQKVETQDSQSSRTEQIVNTQNASIGNNFNSQQIIDLPLTARNTADLLKLQANVNPDGTVAGGRSDQANITLDGVDVNSNNNNGSFSPVLRVDPKKTEEFRVITSNSETGQGRSSGAQISTITNEAKTTLSFSLSPGTLRNEGEQVINIPANSNKINLNLQLPKESAKYETYNATIKNADGEAVLTFPNLNNLKLNLLAEKLENRTYIIFLEGQNPQKSAESIAEYIFRVVRQK